MSLDLGSLVGEVRLDATLFETTYVRVVRQMAELGAKAGGAAAGTSTLDRSLAEAGASANAAAAGLGRADRALAGAGLSASDAAAATTAMAGRTTEAALASSKLTQAQLRQAAAEERLTALQASGTASTGRLAAAQASLIAANDRVALSQKRVNETSLSSMGFFGRLGQSGRDLSGAMSSIPTPVTAVAGALGKLGMVAGGTALAVGALSIDLAQKFQTAITRLHTQANVSTADVAVLQRGILAMAGSVAETPTELAAAAYHIASIGQNSLTTAQQLAILRIATEGAKLGGADLVDVTNALDAAVVSGIAGVHNYSQTMGVLNSTVGAGDMSMQDLAEAFGPLGAVLKGYNVTIQQAGAALATFGDNNIRGADAGTALRMSVQALAVPAAAGKKQLEAWGISAGNLSKQLQHGGLTEALDTLMQKMRANGVTAKEQGDVLTQVFGKRAGVGINVLMGELDRFHNKLGEVSHGASTFGSSWAGYTKTFSYNLDAVKAAAESLGIQLGDKLLPEATKVLHWLATSGVADLVALGHWFQRNAATIGAFGADFVLVFRDMFDAVSFWARGFVDMMDHALGWVPHYGAELHKARLAVDAFADGTHDKLGQLAAGMRSLGQSVSDGYAAGITAGEAAAINAAARMAQAVVRTVQREHAIASPSKVFAALGKEIPAGTAVGIEAGTPKAVAAAKKMAAATKKAVIPPMETLGADLAKALGSGFSGYSGQIAKIFTGSTLSALDAVANRLQTAMSRYQTDVASRSQMRTSITQGLLGAADISQLALSNTGGGAIRTNNATVIAELTRENKDVARLRKLHLDPTYLQQIASASPQQGTALAEDILSGREGSIAGLNRQQRQLQALAGSVGGTVANATFATAIRHDEQALDKVAHALVTFVNKKLDLSSSAERAMERAFERALRRAAPGISVKDLDRALGLSLTHAGG